MDIETIERDELKALLDKGADIKLVMALHEWAFRAMHIPGSINFNTVDAALDGLDEDDDIVVYCSDEACVASQYAYKALLEQGYKHVRRYSGGLSDWLEAGYPLEGEAAPGS